MSEEEITREFLAEEVDDGKRLDVFLSEKVEDWSRSKLKKLIEDGEASVDGAEVKSSHKMKPGETVSIVLSSEDPSSFEPENIPLSIVYEDDYLAVIDKPAGMVVHPGAGISGGTLANAIAYHFGLGTQISSERPANRVGIVHRLDKDTSGLIVVAKNDITHDRLSEQFSSRKVFKSYTALVHGFVRKMSGKIDEPIARDRKNRVRMAVDKNGRSALTLYKVKQRFERFTLLDVEIRTGRTHQIRVHLAHIKHPIVGDATYNEGRDNTIPDAQVKKAVREMDRFFLHSSKLAFTHPVNKERIEFESPLPKALIDVLRMISELGL